MSESSQQQDVRNLTDAEYAKAVSRLREQRAGCANNFSPAAPTAGEVPNARDLSKDQFEEWKRILIRGSYKR